MRAHRRCCRRWKRRSMQAYQAGRNWVHRAASGRHCPCALPVDSRIVIMDLSSTAGMRKRRRDDLFLVHRGAAGRRRKAAFILLISHKSGCEVYEIADNYASFPRRSRCRHGALADTRQNDIVRMMVGVRREQAFFLKQDVAIGKPVLEG